ncbi:MAG: RNA polymerase sigma factor [Opitutales bacterium]
MKQKTDSELLREFSSSGKQQSFARIVERHGPMVHAVSRRILSNEQDAKDVTQATFIILAREASRLTKQPSVAGWLHTVARRASLDALKSRKTRQHYEEAAMNDPTTHTLESNSTQEWRPELDAALESLPLRYRQPLVLFHLEGASLAEVAQQLRLRPSTLGTRLSRARELLRKALGRRGFEVASASVIAVMLTEEAKASQFSDSLYLETVEAASGSSSALSPSLLELVNGFSGVKASEGGLLALASAPWFNTAAISSVVVAGTLGIYAYIKSGEAPDAAPEPAVSEPVAASSNPEPHSASSAPTIDHPVGKDTNSLSPENQETLLELSELSMDEFKALMDATFYISDEKERLTAIREQLGMPISDAVYTDVLAQQGFSFDPQRFYKHLFATWAEEAPFIATLWAQSTPEKVRNQIMPDIFISWLHQDEPAALKWGTQHLSPKELALCQTRMEFQQANPQFAMNNVLNVEAKWREIPDTDEAPLMESTLRREFRQSMREWAADAPLEATQYAIHQLEDEYFRRLGLEIAFTELSITDPDAALHMAQGLSSDEERLDALVDTLPAWQLKYLERTIDEVVDVQEFSENQYAELLENVVTDWAAAEPLRAMDFAQSLEREEVRDFLATEVLDNWARKDPAQAGGWILNMPEGPQRDKNLARVSRSIGATNLELTKTMIQAIGNPKEELYAAVTLLSSSELLNTAPKEALELIPEAEVLSYRSVEQLAQRVSSDGAEPFLAWFERSHAAGKIQYLYGNENDPELADERHRKLLRSIQQKSN